MATKHLGILNAIQAAIQAAVAAGVPVTVGKARPISGEDAQAVNVDLDVSSLPGNLTQTRSNWSTSIEVQCYARATGAVSVFAAVDPLLQTVFNALLANNTLGGLAQDVTPGDSDTVRWEWDELNEGVAKATVRLTVLHQSADRQIS